MIRRTAAIALGAILLGACQTGDDTVAGVRLYRYGAQAGLPTALQSGVLRIHDGCTFLEAEGGSQSLILWPSAARLEAVGSSVVVSLSGVSAGNGDGVQLGGGEYRSTIDAEKLVGAISDRCATATYWLASTLARS